MPQKSKPLAVYDLVILGAGINGTGIALEARRHKLRVLILEKGEVATGTSSRSSRLIHGGLRYLETFDFHLVHEALRDREYLARRYPHLVHLIPFYLPVYDFNWRPPWMIRAGLGLYDLLSGRAPGAGHGRLGARTFAKQFKALRSAGLRAVYHYLDGKTNDAALTRYLAAEFRHLKGRIWSHCPPTRISWDSEQFLIETRRGTVRSRYLINATGPWVEEVNRRFAWPARYHLRPVSGVHLFFPGLLVPQALLLQTSGRRIFFVIPEKEQEQTYVGTTERLETGPMDEVRPRREDVLQLLREVNRYLRPAHRLREENVIQTVIGVRPLVGTKGSLTTLSRDYKIDVHRRGKTSLIHIFGGKLTTFPSLARRVTKIILSKP